MSFEETWSYQGSTLDPAEIADAALALGEEVGISSQWQRGLHGGTWSIEVPAGEMARVAAALEILGAVLRGPVEGGEPAHGDTFQLEISFHVRDDEPAPRQLMLYSNNADNRAGWHVAYRLADLLAQRTGATASSFFAEELGLGDGDRIVTSGMWNGLQLKVAFRDEDADEVAAVIDDDDATSP